MPDWWLSPSTWAPQDAKPLWSRRMDWYAMCGHETGEAPHITAKRAGVTVESLRQRVRVLVAYAARPHWRMAG